MEDLSQRTDEELEAIIRRAENTNISGSRYQRAKIELELRDRKEKDTLDLVDTVRVKGSIEKKIKRGRESWNFFWLVFAILLTITTFIISILPLAWVSRMLIFVTALVVISWICLISPKWQNKLIGLKMWLEETWRKV